MKVVIVESSSMLKLPTDSPVINNAININADPNNVYITNFIAEYSLRPEPQIEIIKYIGISSISQKIKKSTKSKEIKTPKTEVSKIKNQKKYSATRVFTDIEI